MNPIHIPKAYFPKIHPDIVLPSTIGSTWNTKEQFDQNHVTALYAMADLSLSSSCITRRTVTSPCGLYWQGNVLYKT
jgi:hypothetical protein